MVKQSAQKGIIFYYQDDNCVIEKRAVEVHLERNRKHTNLKRKS